MSCWNGYSNGTAIDCHSSPFYRDSGLGRRELFTCWSLGEASSICRAPYRSSEDARHFIPTNGSRNGRRSALQDLAEASAEQALELPAPNFRRRRISALAKQEDYENVELQPLLPFDCPAPLHRESEGSRGQRRPVGEHEGLHAIRRSVGRGRGYLAPM